MKMLGGKSEDDHKLHGESHSSLTKTDLGLYVDGGGKRYFYLSAMYPLFFDKAVPSCFWKNPGVVSGVLQGLREDHMKAGRLELTD